MPVPVYTCQTRHVAELGTKRHRAGSVVHRNVPAGIASPHGCAASHLSHQQRVHACLYTAVHHNQPMGVMPLGLMQRRCSTQLLWSSRAPRLCLMPAHAAAEPGGSPSTGQLLLAHHMGSSTASSLATAISSASSSHALDELAAGRHSLTLLRQLKANAVLGMADMLAGELCKHAYFLAAMQQHTKFRAAARHQQQQQQQPPGKAEHQGHRSSQIQLMQRPTMRQQQQQQQRQEQQVPEQGSSGHAWTAGAVEELGTQFLTEITPVLHKRMHELCGDDLALILQALAITKPQNPALFSALCRAAAQQVPDMSAPSLASAAAAVGSSGRCTEAERALMDGIAEASLAVLPAFGPVELSGLLLAFGKLRLRHVKLVRAGLEHLSVNMGRWPLKAVGRALWAIGELQCADIHSLERVAFHVSTRLRNLRTSTQSLETSAHSSAQPSGGTSSSSSSSLEDRIGSNHGSSSSSSSSSNRGSSSAGSSSVPRRSSYSSGISLQNAAEGGGGISLHSPPPSTSSSDSGSSSSSGSSGRIGSAELRPDLQDGLVRIAWAFGVLHHYDQVLFKELFRALCAFEVSSYTEEQLPLLWTAHVKAQDLSSGVEGCDPKLAECYDTYKRLFNRAPSRALALPTSLQLLAFTHGQLDSSWGEADAQPGSCMELGGDSHGVDLASEHALQRSICKALEHLGIKPKPMVTLDGHFQVPLALNLNGVCIALEVLEPEGCARNVPHAPLAAAVARRRSLECRGWVVVEVLWKEWLALGMEGAERSKSRESSGSGSGSSEGSVSRSNSSSARCSGSGSGSDCEAAAAHDNGQQDSESDSINAAVAEAREAYLRQALALPRR